MSSQSSSADLLGFCYARVAPYLPSLRGSTKDYKLFNELRTDISSLPPLESGKTANTWDSFRRSVRELILLGNVERFLRWKPIRIAMFADGDTRVYSEYRELTSRNDWQTVWKPLTRERSIGSPVPFWYDKESSGNLLHQAYHLARFQDVTGQTPWKYKTIIEFGGGYGCMSRLITAAGFKGRYIIFDLPEFCALQTYYLNSNGISCTNFNRAHSSLPASSVYTISSFDQIQALLEGSFQETLFLGMWSLSEAPLSVRAPFEPIISRVGAVLLGIRDEFEGVNNVEYFERLLRDRSAKKLPIPCTSRDFYLIAG